MGFEPSPYQQAIYNEVATTDHNINVNAVAGSGKTTTLLGCLERIPRGKSIIFMAFNNSIVKELQARNRRPNVDIMTLHSYGWRLLLRRYGNAAKMNPNKSIAKLEVVLKRHSHDEAVQELLMRRKKGYLIYLIPKIVDLMRTALCRPEIGEIEALCEYHDIDCGPLEKQLALETFAVAAADVSQFDFTDMLYVPVTDPSVRFRKYEVIMVDESQDMSLLQHELIKRALDRRSRLITVGDPRQAIYGFAGADANSYARLAELNGTSVEMPLSVCYRCGRRIVEEAEKIVPYIRPYERAHEGEVALGSLNDIEDGDWIICRNLRPLIEVYLWLLKNKIKSQVRGKDIGRSLVDLIDKTGARTVDQLDALLMKEADKLAQKLRNKGWNNPDASPKMDELFEKIEVIRALAVEASTIAELRDTIEGIFTDELKGILLMTIHKSKGLENDNVFFLAPELIPSRFATQPWQLEQELNLKYVAITRAKNSLIYVPLNQKDYDLHKPFSGRYSVQAHDDELNKAEDRIEDTLEEDRIERRQQRDVPSPRQIANVLRSENIDK